jgi:putative nucleotidyltransferase with HDIG domain
MISRALFGPVIAVLTPYLLFEYLRMDTSMDHLFVTPSGHFYVVSTVAILGIIIAIAVGVAGTRVRNIQVSFLSLAFVSLAEVFAVHGLATPNFLIHATHLPSVAAQLSILLATIWLWLSSFSSDHPLIEMLSRRRSLLLPVWTGVLSGLCVVSLIFPHLVDFIQLDVHPLNIAITVVTIVLNAITMYRYVASYMYSRFPLQLSIVYSSGWLITSQMIMQLGESWRLSWWIYHFLLLASMIVMVIGLVLQYARNQSLAGALRALFTTDPIERISDSLSPSVKTLMMATESKDSYTAGHNFRVTMYALKMAEELKAKPEQLRALAQGTIVHDVGKIKIPDPILNKPEKLTTEERSIIETHPIEGYEMCKKLGFMKEELSIIRSHHEKWNGSGYPDQLKGEQIPLLARIVSVADVYDALTSNRSYRKAWSHEEALKFLEENKGSHFDPACVEAWVRVTDRDPSVYQYPAMMIKENTRILKSVSDVHRG